MLSVTSDSFGLSTYIGQVAFLFRKHRRIGIGILIIGLGRSSDPYTLKTASFWWIEALAGLLH